MSKDSTTKGHLYQLHYLVTANVRSMDSSIPELPQAKRENWDVSKDGLPNWHSGKESTCRPWRQGFSPWVGKIPWRRKWQPTAVFLPVVKFCVCFIARIGEKSHAHSWNGAFLLITSETRMLCWPSSWSAGRAGKCSLVSSVHPVSWQSYRRCESFLFQD